MASAPRRPGFDPDAPNDLAIEAAFEAAPETVVAEILDGELQLMSRPPSRQAHAANPIAETLEVYRREGDAWLLVDTFEGAAVVRAEPFDAIDLAPIWGR